ncbi:MAG: competence/damage-inducible protein A [bacterium]
MHTEIVSVGTELLDGHINTDGPFIGEQLLGIGVSVERQTTVADQKQQLLDVLREVLERSDIIIITGGLGPTFDDITRETLAEVLQKKLVFNKEVMEDIASSFAKRGIRMPKENDRQAYIIEGAMVIINKFGTAPGMIIEEKKKQIIVLPGPPRELEPMVRDSVLLYLKKKIKRKIIKNYLIHICGMTESEVHEKIYPILETEKKLENEALTFALLARPCVVDVKISVKGNNEMVIEGLVKKLVRELRDCLGEAVFGENEDTLQSVVGNLLAKKRVTVSVAESCTGGLLGNLITSVNGSSLYFKGGVIAYSNKLKTEVLKVPDSVLLESGAVSSEVALAMASGVRDISGAGISLGITGIAGPGGGTKDKPVGLVYIAVSSEKGKEVNEYRFVGSRQEIKYRSAMAALDMLRRVLLKL